VKGGEVGSGTSGETRGYAPGMMWVVRVKSSVKVGLRSGEGSCGYTVDLKARAGCGRRGSHGRG